ncbi:fumarylacetoacetate hydrolase family protein [Streptomyces sp. NPDC090088]|uniref:fumarylacetoacetate hydrolase family protein n=1 Tax=Streptomyces sp. NPDC090088 TaxID=3365944 RepID=UPI0038253A97
MGPVIVPAAFADVEESMRIVLRGNGHVMQDWPANDMNFDFPRLGVHAAKRLRSRPGDLSLGDSSRTAT